MLLPHLLERVGQLLVRNLLRVLELQKPVATVSRQIDENITARIAEQLLRPSGAILEATGQQTHKVLDGHVVATKVHLDVVAVHIDILIGIVEDGRRSRVPRIARHVVSHHEDDLAVGNAQAL